MSYLKDREIWLPKTPTGNPPAGYFWKFIQDGVVVVRDSAGIDRKMVDEGNIKTINGDSVLGSGDLEVGGGKVLQVVYASTDTEVTVSTTTYTDTTLTATITPKKSTSKILVIVSQGAQAISTSELAFGGIRLLRGADVIFDPNPETATGPFGFGVYMGDSGATAANLFGTIALNYEDSPATTSATTYKTQGRPFSTSGGEFIQFQRNQATTNAKSTIILMEIEA